MLIESLFFELIQISIGERSVFSHTPNANDWISLYSISHKQSLVGVCFEGIKILFQRHPEQVKYLQSELKLKWLAQSLMLQKKNEIMNEATSDALAYFRGKGFPCIVLKGQGVAQLYGPLATARQSGDIDVWLSGGRKKVYALSKQEFGKIMGANYHHIHFPILDNVEIEAHIYPSFLSNPIRNYHLHRFCKLYEPYDGCGDYPSIDFNRIFILLHCYRHLCGHGVGLRQLMDYYYVLKQGFTESEGKDTLYWCNKLGMNRFVRATMWVMKTIFNLDDKFILCEPDEKEGRFLINEILQTGNMGHSDERFKWGQQRALFRFIESQKRNIHLITHYPKEVCWSPLFNIVRFCWIKINGLNS